MANTISETIYKDLHILEDEDNPHGSKVKRVYPSTTIDQVFDDKDSENPTLREILEELHQEIITGGIGSIVFPVTSVNGEQGDVVITQDSLGMGILDLTADIDKPLSNPQREAVNEMINNHKCEVDLSDLYDHINDSNNPHAVTFDQINKSGAVDDLIATYLTRHNESTSEDTHRDLRNTLKTIEENAKENNDRIEEEINDVLKNIYAHIEDNGAHSELFDEKEDASNKTTSLDDYNDINYPTSKAVVEYVLRSIEDAVDSIIVPDEWISDIQVVDNINELPKPIANMHHKMYFIIHGNNFCNEVAICRYEDGTYYWEYHTLGSYTSFDSTYFEDSPNGLSLNQTALAHAVLNEQSVVDMFKEIFSKSIPELMENYYTKEEIDANHFVSSITILTGTQDGMIRYYINGDQTTMSEDVKVAGLKKLAFLEKVTERDLEDNSVTANAIQNRAVERRHMADGAVGAVNMYGSYMTMFANVNDSTGDRVDEVTIDEMAELFGPKFREIFESSTIYQDFEAAARKFAREEIHKYHGWPYPEYTANFLYSSTNGELQLYTDDDAGDIDISVKDNNVIATFNEEDPIAKVMNNTNFSIKDDNLIMNIS